MVFMDVGGEWRFITKTPFETDAECKAFGTLLRVIDRTCFRYDKHPWIVSVQDGTPIHLMIGGFLFVIPMETFCRDPDPTSGCEPSVSFIDKLYCAFDDCDQGVHIGTYQFTFLAPPYLGAPPINVATGSQIRSPGAGYHIVFSIKELPVLHE